MDRGRPTRLSSKSGCGGERTVKAWPHRWLGAGVPAPPPAAHPPAEGGDCGAERAAQLPGWWD